MGAFLLGWGIVRQSNDESPLDASKACFYNYVRHICATHIPNNDPLAEQIYSARIGVTLLHSTGHHLRRSNFRVISTERRNLAQCAIFDTDENFVFSLREKRKSV